MEQINYISKSNYGHFETGSKYKPRKACRSVGIKSTVLQYQQRNFSQVKLGNMKISFSFPFSETYCRIINTKKLVYNRRQKLVYKISKESKRDG